MDFLGQPNTNLDLETTAKVLDFFLIQKAILFYGPLE